MIELSHDEYKIFPSQEGEEFLFLGKFPLHWLVYYLSVHREFTKELTILHIQKYYDLDISSAIDSFDWSWNPNNIYKDHVTQYPREGFNTPDREYFASKGRSYYLKFATGLNNPNKDFLYSMMNYDVVHHIHPLSTGGTNKLENLIHISNFNHNLLHINPLEQHEKYCHQAVDYLWYLHHPFIQDKALRLVDKYKLNLYPKEMPKSFLIDIYKAMIKQEMNEFYDDLIQFYQE